MLRQEGSAAVASAAVAEASAAEDSEVAGLPAVGFEMALPAADSEPPEL
jgi:hypothetical protein